MEYYVKINHCGLCVQLQFQVKKAKLISPPFQFISENRFKKALAE